MFKIKQNCYRFIFINVFLLLVMSPGNADPVTVTEDYAEKPQWEFGLGLGGLSIPHYRGSDQKEEYYSPVPYIRYNGKRLKIDREGGRYFFYKSDVLKIDVSTAFALPVDSDDNLARQGMQDLDPIIELGPRVQFSLYESEDKNLRFRFAIPLRAAIATTLSETENIGMVFSPYFQLRYFTSGWESAIAFGPMWASEKYHDYFYAVDPQYVTATRSLYDAKEGYSGSRITLNLSKRFDKVFFGMFARYDNLDNAVFMDSPLIRQDDSLMVGVAISWVFKESKVLSKY